MSLSRKVNIVVINIVVVLVLIVFIEGFLSYASIGYAFFTQKITEREHTAYDEELGWINLPNLHIEDMYGHDVYFSTNSQRYRNANDFTPEVPAGKVRIICSGDSFTLGFGVDDDHTFCQQLAGLDNRLETVNMGQGGYGIDQAYLWYRRDEAKLEHDVVLFAFITSDFIRMESDTFYGYGRPWLTLRDGELFQENFPVPSRSYNVSWLTVNLYMLQQLNTVKFMNKVFGSVRSQGDASPVVKDHRHTEEVVAKIYSELQQISLANQRQAVLVYLPTLADYEGTGTGRWREFVRAEAGKNDYFFVDLVEEMRTLPGHTVKKMFRKGGHYSDEGNRYVAEALYKKLMEIPEIESKLQR